MPQYIIYCSYEYEGKGDYHVLSYDTISGTYRHFCSIENRASAEKVMNALTKESDNENA
jgi:hypothetical protein